MDLTEKNTIVKQYVDNYSSEIYESLSNIETIQVLILENYNKDDKLTEDVKKEIISLLKPDLELLKEEIDIVLNYK